MTFLNGFGILVIAAGNGEVFYIKLERSIDGGLRRVDPKLILYYKTLEIQDKLIQ
jgi:hypothetical protein